MVANDEGIDCREVSIQVVKRALTGHGNATKAEMMEACRAYGLSPADDNEADSFGGWIASVTVLRPQFRDLWLPLFVAGRHVTPKT